MSHRKFKTGAYRDHDIAKYDYEAFLSPLVLQRYAEYMHKHRFQKNGKVRDGDNWQKGMSKATYIKSAFRHVMDWWLFHRGRQGRDDIEEAICALIFNASGYLFELLKEKGRGRA